MNMERSTEPVLLNGLTPPCSLESSTITTSTVKVFTCGVMVASTKVNGRTTKCTVRAALPGQTDVCMWVSTLTIRRTVMANSTGPMAGAIRATGKMENSTAMACTSLSKAWRSTENGRKENATVGFEQFIIKLVPSLISTKHFIIFKLA